MKAITLEPISRIEGEINLPGSKSLSNRALLLAALAKGTKHLPKQINGINILPLFYGKQVDTDNRLLYWEFPGKQRAARKGDWKCVTIHPNQPLELYNLKEDPEETNNLAKKYPRRVKEFDEEMQ